MVCACIALVLLLAGRHHLYAGIDASWWWLLGCISVATLVCAGLAHAGHRVGWHPARWLVAAGVLGFVVFAGAATATSALLLVLCALALSPRTTAMEGMPRILIGLAVLVAVVGWLLPFPVHASNGYRAIVVLLCVWRGKTLLGDCRRAWHGWKTLEQEAGVWLVLLVAAVCVAGLGLWLPSLSYDDNATHLSLPYQLLRDGYDHLDVSSHVWAAAPWANNVLHATAALLAGHEARAAVGLLWLLLGVHGAWRLASVLGGNRNVALAAAALFASLPLTGYFTTTMQVDGASAAVLLQLAAVLVAAGRVLPPALLLAALLALLAGLKTSNGVYALPAMLWLAWLAMQQRQWRWLLAVLGGVLLLAGSSYFYATWITGSPVFPLFNATFKSPYFAPVNFIDQHWLTGVSWRALWDLTFHSDRFGEHYPGAFGIALLALLPALAVALWRKPSARVVAFWFAGTGLLLFWQIQYLRYIFPAIAVLVVIGVFGLARAVPEKLFTPLLAVLVVANAALIPTTVWYMRDAVWEQLLRQGPSVQAGIEASRIPERALLRRVLAGAPDACVLMTDKRAPFAAMAAGRAVTTKKIHDPRMGNTAAWADEDASGGRWLQALAVLGSSHVMTSATPTPALQAALVRMAYRVVDTQGTAQVWAAADVQAHRCHGQLEQVRDEARRHFQIWGR
jgi:hypothetical protein